MAWRIELRQQASKLTARLSVIFLAAATLGAPVVGGGCQTIRWSRLTAHLPKISTPFGTELEGEHESLAASVERMGGPLRRAVARMSGPVKEDSSASRGIDKEELEREYSKAKQLYDSGDYAQAEEALKRFVNKDQSWLWRFTHGDELPESARANPYREDALFYLAESQFFQQKFPDAADNYMRLMKQYPSTQYLDQATRRLFHIARLWLGVNDIEEASEIQQVAGQDATPKKLPSVQAAPIVPNLFDRQRPVVDTGGHALRALKAIWLNDPTGPLADDALMLAATYHLRKKHYTEADHLFKVLREEYPDSPHVANAFLLGSHVKLMSYQGAEYDEQALLEAERLKKAALQLVSDPEEKERLKKELQEIRLEKAARDWARVEFYLRKRKPQAAAVYCRLILREHADTPFAKKAEKVLAELTAQPGSVRLKDSGSSGLLRAPRLAWPRLKPVPSSSASTSVDSDSSEGRVKLSD